MVAHLHLISFTLPPRTAAATWRQLKAGEGGERCSLLSAPQPNRASMASPACVSAGRTCFPRPASCWPQTVAPEGRLQRLRAALGNRRDAAAGPQVLQVRAVAAGGDGGAGDQVCVVGGGVIGMTTALRVKQVSEWH